MYTNEKRIVEPCLRVLVCTGEIPTTIGKLTNLQYLDLSKNKFEGACVCTSTYHGTKSLGVP